MNTKIKSLIETREISLATEIVREFFDEEDIDFNGWYVTDIKGENFGDLTEIYIYLESEFANIGMVMHVDSNCTLTFCRAYKTEN